MIIARHIIEHVLDVAGAIKNWSKHLKPGGRLIIAAPNEALVSGIPLNPEHCHAFTPESITNIVELLGFKHSSTYDPRNGISFVCEFQKKPASVSNGFYNLDRMYEGDISTIPMEARVL